MGLLSGGGAALLTNIFSAIYLDGRVYRETAVYDEYGELTVSTATVPCKIQIDSMTEAMGAQEGAADSDRRALVLAADGVTVGTDDSVEALEGPYTGSRYLVMSVSRDPVGSYFDCRVRRAG